MLGYAGLGAVGSGMVGLGELRSGMAKNKEMK